MCSPVNQKIATKTISKLGFQVNATWNGREALDYLLEAHEGHQTKPDIILMDVQMPVIDGYKCTHLLRYHRPYKALVQNIPIVAMTASAIQGDREKCTKAGMDDYLSKPVTMSILETMLVKWCNRRLRRPSQPEVTASDCSEMSEHCDTAEIPSIEITEQVPEINHENSDEILNSPETPRPLSLIGLQGVSPFDAPAANDLTPRIQRPEGEKEWSSMLQENKLIDAAGGPQTPFRSHSYTEKTNGEALTEENMEKHKNESQKSER